MAALSWALIGLAVGGANFILHDDKQHDSPTWVMFVIATVGGLFGGMLGAAFGLGSYTALAGAGTWLSALGWAGLLLVIFNVVARVKEEGPWHLE